MEVDNEEEIREMPGEDPFDWRRRLLNAYRESFPDAEDVPAEISRDMEDFMLYMNRGALGAMTSGSESGGSSAGRARTVTTGQRACLMTYSATLPKSR